MLLTGVVVVGAALASPAVEVSSGHAQAPALAPQRQISWWWSSTDSECGNATAPCPEVDALLGFVQAHPSIVTTVIMRCGVVTCCRLHCGDYPSSPWTSQCDNTRGNCSNNNGVGGVITGGVNPACQRAIPQLHKLGVRVELWLGEDDSIASPRYMFAHPEATAAALVAIHTETPAITGFNVDFETHLGTEADTVAFTAFLKSVTAALKASSPSVPLRFSADVACGDAVASSLDPMTTNCSRLGRAGADRIMNMATCEWPRVRVGGWCSWTVTSTSLRGLTIAVLRLRDVYMCASCGTNQRRCDVGMHTWVWVKWWGGGQRLSGDTKSSEARAGFAVSP